jgi:hypothetical protein
MVIIKRIFSILLSISIFATVVGCTTEEPKPKPRDTSNDTRLSKSMVYANTIANTVQAYYTTPDRDSYTIANTQMKLVHELGFAGEKNVSKLQTLKGKTYIENSLDVFIENNEGRRYYASKSPSSGRMNTTRLGFYYYESHIRELGFSTDEGELVGNKVDITGLDSKDWKVHQMESPVYNNGVILKVTNTHDPYVSRSGLNIDNTKYNGIEVKMKVDGAAQVAEVYYFTADKGNFNAEQRLSFQVKNDGKFHTYVLDLAGAGEYNAPLKGIRFDIGSAVGDVITIEYVKAIQTSTRVVPFKLDKTFHTYPDKLHQEFRVIATSEASNIQNVGFEAAFDKKNVAKIQFRDKNGVGSDISKMDSESVEYVAFDIKKVGVIGFIVPSDGSTKSVVVTEEGSKYVLRQYANLTKNSFKRMDEESFGNRLYTDTSNSFDGIDKAANLERNPLNDINVLDSNANARFAHYDHLRGAYRFTMDGSNFNKAYYREPDTHYTATIKIKSDGNDRDFYIWMNTDAGGLECAGLLDDTKTLIPIPMQVCKNFKGEIEEPFYDPIDPAYGDTFFPLRLNANEEAEFTLLNLYQNWGNYPLKQLSSIQFHISYYHLSTGVTESNCIAPYFVYGKDGWTLPDFRGASGIMWDSQPQFNSVGRLYFLSYQKDRNIGSEYTGSHIRCAGQTYVDMDYSYVSDCGSYKYTLRHVEFPQLDENRTYYSLSLEFLKNLTIDNVREDFTIFAFDGRFTYFKQTGYLDKDNNPKVERVDTLAPGSRIFTLGTENPYFSYFDLHNGENVMNFGFILKSSNITIGGKKFKGNFAYRDSFDGNLNTGAISLDLGKTTFKKGDKIQMDFILLPYGSHNDKHDDNVRMVREDSALNPLKIEAITGTVVKDAYIPRIKCENNRAEFRITGGRNNNVVCVDGFTNIKKPNIYELVDGEYVPYEYSVHEYDGYSVHFNMDGTYSFSFVFEMESPSTERVFKIEN